MIFFIGQMLVFAIQTVDELMKLEGERDIPLIDSGYQAPPFVFWALWAMGDEALWVASHYPFY